MPREDWGEPYEGVRNSGEAFDKFTSEHPEEGEEIYKKEMKRRERKNAGLFKYLKDMADIYSDAIFSIRFSTQNVATGGGFAS